MRLPVVPATATARLWLAAVASAAVIGGAYLLESHGRTRAAAGLVAAGVAAGAARFLASSRADRRYAKVLEHEVATQTRSLVDSLAATADAERHLRLVMDAVPDAIAVLDRDGRVIDLNESAKRLLAAPPNAGAGRSVFASLEADAAATVRERLAAAFRGEVPRFGVAGARAGGSTQTHVDLYDLVRPPSALRAYHLTTLNIAVTLELSPAEHKFWAERSELQQMLRDLLINAEQALVAVETSRTSVLRTA